MIVVYAAALVVAAEAVALFDRGGWARTGWWFTDLVDKHSRAAWSAVGCVAVIMVVSMVVPEWWVPGAVGCAWWVLSRDVVERRAHVDRRLDRLEHAVTQVHRDHSGRVFAHHINQLRHDLDATLRDLTDAIDDAIDG